VRIDPDELREALSDWRRRQRVKRRRRREQFRQWRQNKLESIRSTLLYRVVRAFLARILSFGVIQWLIVVGVLTITVGATAVLVATGWMLVVAVDSGEPRSILSAGTLLIVQGGLLVYSMSIFIDQFSS
jgi:protein-S-isoprenylcysteine O-methyltransferase Ste14